MQLLNMQSGAFYDDSDTIREMVAPVRTCMNARRGQELWAKRRRQIEKAERSRDTLPDSTVTVVGRVHRPGDVAWTTGTRVVDALAATGGLLRHAASKAILVFRPLSGGRVLRFRILTDQPDRNMEMLLLPQDVLHIPAA